MDDRWQVKVEYYGLKSIKTSEPKTMKCKILRLKITPATFLALLWAAPEIIRNGNLAGTKPGDVYSFAIICAEVVTRKAPWNLAEIFLSEEELIYRVKKGGVNPLRPSLNVDPSLELNPSLVKI